MTSTPHPATREYRRQAIRVSDLVVTEPLIQDVRFENCQILGPAVLFSLEGVTMSSCVFDADFDVLAWVIPPSRPGVIGAIGLLRVEFFACRFQQIGLTIYEHEVAAARRGFGL